MKVGKVGMVSPLASRELIRGHRVHCVSRKGIVTEFLQENSSVAILMHSVPFLIVLVIRN